MLSSHVDGLTGIEVLIWVRILQKCIKMLNNVRFKHRLANRPRNYERFGVFCVDSRCIHRILD